MNHAIRNLPQSHLHVRLADLHAAVLHRHGPLLAVHCRHRITVAEVVIVQSPLDHVVIHQSRQFAPVMRFQQVVDHPFFHLFKGHIRRRQEGIRPAAAQHLVGIGGVDGFLQDPKVLVNVDHLRNIRHMNNLALATCQQCKVGQLEVGGGIMFGVGTTKQYRSYASIYQSYCSHLSLLKFRGSFSIFEIPC